MCGLQLKVSSCSRVFFSLRPPNDNGIAATLVSKWLPNAPRTWKTNLYNKYKLITNLSQLNYFVIMVGWSKFGRSGEGSVGRPESCLAGE